MPPAVELPCVISGQEVKDRQDCVLLSYFPGSGGLFSLLLVTILMYSLGFEKLDRVYYNRSLAIDRTASRTYFGMAMRRF